MVSSKFKKEAREKLTGKWGKAVCITLIYFALFFIINLLQERTSGFANTVVTILNLLIEIPLGFGLVTCFVKLFNGEDVKVYDFLSFGFDQFGKSWGISLRIVLKLIFPIIMLLSSTFVATVGTMLLSNAVLFSYWYGTSINVGYVIITLLGIITLIYSYIYLIARAYYYDLAFIIAAENPNMSCKDAVSRSSRLMFNHRWKLFVLEVSFIGWLVLAVISFGIGVLWLAPYMNFAKISYYKHLKEE